MAVLNLDEPHSTQKVAILNSGFRIFFLAAGVFAVVSMAFWLATYSLMITPALHRFEIITWHAHEMIYGYGMAVISGFLLTAVTNWTSYKTLTGLSLGLVFVFWLIARVFPFVSVQNNVEWMFVFETVFFILLIAGISKPIIKSKQWKQVPIVMVVIAIMLFNIAFYAGHLEFFNDGVRIGLYGGFFMILVLVIIMARRVIPFFIEKGVENNFSANNCKLVDMSTVPLLLVYIALEILQLEPIFISSVAGLLFFFSVVRVCTWYTNAIWKKPLVWVLVTSYISITLGFGLKTLSYFNEVSDLIVLHAFAVGGVGMLTVGMMARVALGHTGRNVFKPPKVVVWIFSFIACATVLRVIFPLFSIENYYQWIVLSQLFWVAAFSLFTVSYGKYLIMPRIDGSFG